MTSRTRTPQINRRTQRGLSLVELMVALTIGLFLLGAVGIIYVNTATTSRSSTLESQMNEDAALALELLQQQIRLTGFSNVDASGNRLFPGQAVRGCDGGFDDNTAVFLDPASPPLLSCNGGAGPDALAVRYEASLLNSQTVTDAGGVQRPGNCAHEGITAWNAQAEGAATATAMTLADNRYYIADDADGTPSLFCQGRTGTGFGNATALIPNIEDMQVQYAVTALPSVGNPIPHQVAGYVTADQTANGAEVLGDTSINWSRVAAVRVCLLARSARPVPTGDNTLADVGRYIDCDGAEQTPTDRFLRRAYVTTIQLRNMRPGLPSDYELGGDPWQYMYDN
ncbi:PilW family protein [Hydrogenophaga pseudoflava]|uniref:PilW family protein n=1 Tax=Hydrogenophaga pseudoflava TaxID=47421 RepID=UPI0027E4408A|nr:PilW family protein [Hydrogenophaga pseudoflava]MDQ7747368.1 PilW family protein [Hydrogenophaga pseudoflava]